jgi:hypothetical protein
VTALTERDTVSVEEPARERREEETGMTEMSARPCRCEHVWEFEWRHCTACGRSIEERAA